MSRELNDIITRDLETRFAGMDGCVVFDYQGLSAGDTFELRRRLRKDGVLMNVVQNRLSKRVFSEREDIPGEFTDLFRGPTALLTSEEGTLRASKSISNWLKENKDSVEIRGGLFEGKVLTKEDVNAMAKIPDKETLLAQTAGMFLSPVQFLPSAAKSLVSHLAGCAKARHEELSDS